VAARFFASSGAFDPDPTLIRVNFDPDPAALPWLNVSGQLADIMKFYAITMESSRRSRPCFFAENRAKQGETGRRARRLRASALL